MRNHLLREFLQLDVSDDRSVHKKVGPTKSIFETRNTYPYGHSPTNCVNCDYGTFSEALQLQSDKNVASRQLT